MVFDPLPPDSSRGTLVPADVAFAEGDVTDNQQVSACFSAFCPDAVCHLTTYYAVQHKSDEIETMLRTNVLGTTYLLEAAQDAGVGLFINTSSCFVYRPGSEPLTETSPLDPLNLYAATKVQAEQLCSYYASKCGLPCVSLRLFPPYGPGDRDRRLIPYAIRQLAQNAPVDLTSGSQQWDYTYVGDVADAYAAVIDSAPAFGEHEVLNVGAGNPVSVRNLVEELKRISGSSSEIRLGRQSDRPHDFSFMCADSTKIRERAGWTPRTTLEHGLRQTMEWFTDDKRQP